jgi:hypothetical protein
MVHAREGQSHHRKLTRTPAQVMPESQTEAALDSGLMWQAEKGERVRTVQATGRRLSESRMRARLRRHVRFEVAEDGNRDMVWVVEALSVEHLLAGIPFADLTIEEENIAMRIWVRK